MRALILALAVGLALAASAQAAPLAHQPAAIEPDVARPIELIDHACGWGLHRVHWQEAIGIGTAFHIITVTRAKARGSNIPTQIGAVRPGVW